MGRVAKRPQEPRQRGNAEQPAKAHVARERARRETADASLASKDDALSAKDDALSAKDDALETTNSNQGTTLSNRISVEATTNTSQKTNIETLFEQNSNQGTAIADIRETIRSLQSQIKNLQETNKNQSERLAVLDEFRNRPSGFASSASNHTTTHSH